MLLATTAVCVLGIAPEAHAKPNLPEWLELDAEYRVQTNFIDPLEINGLTTGQVWYSNQRFRLDTGLKIPGTASLKAQFDFLDGALFGDNGDYNSVPAPSSGLALTSRWPNASSWDVGLMPGKDPLSPDSYGLVLTDVTPIKLNRLYGVVNLPFGLLQIGRQPATTGPGINIHDGSRSNRWGVSNYAATADRFLFATKVSEVFRMVALGDDYAPDRSMDDGVFIGGAYDVVVEDDLAVGGDDLHQIVGLIQFKVKEPTLGGWNWDPFLLQMVVGARFGEEFSTDVLAFPVTLRWGLGPVSFLGEFVAILGSTREISAGMAALRESDEAKRVINDQEIRMFGARAVLDVEMGPFTGTLEFDYASGDADPRDETPLTTFNFARDSNVGLLLFEHILAFETARSAAVGIENLKSMGAASFPLTELTSDGRVHNTIAAFPQLLFKPVDSFGIRFGALMAWADEPVTDTIMTILAEDGVIISDDAVNWHGGKPADYYGTELDLQIEWKYRDHFLWTVEGAVLFPGDALKDESGDAINSFLVQNRFTFLF